MMPAKNSKKSRRKSDDSDSSSGGPVTEKASIACGDPERGGCDYEKINSIIEKQLSPILQRLSLLDSELANITSKLDNSILNLQKSISTLVDDVTNIKSTLKQVQSESIKSKKVQLELKNMQDEYEQRMRNYSVRLYNVQVPSELEQDQIGYAKHIYDHIIVPVFTQAKESGDLQDIPPIHSTIDATHPLPSTRTAAANRNAKGKTGEFGERPATQQTPPPIILRFQSRHLKVIFSKNKKTVFERINSEMGNSKEKQWFSQPDYTFARRECLKKLRNMKEVNPQKVYMRGTTIKFVKEGESFPTAVVNIFGQTLADMIEI